MRRLPYIIAFVSMAMGNSAADAQNRGATPTYLVYPIPVESPDHTEPLPPADARVLLDDPSDPTASPFSWHDDDGVPGADYTTTQGNNTLVYYDENGNGGPDPDEFADGGPDLMFDFPLDLENPPFESADAVLTNLFYWANSFHDILYRYGFDEAAGNAQENNYGNGGNGGDPLHVEGRDNTSGVTTSVPPDGSAPRIIMSLLDTGPPFGPIALDNWVTVHLLTHTTSIRLTGGPGNSSCLANVEQMGEGWSDWYGLMFTMREDDTRLTLRLDEGIRPAPYTTDFAVNAFTYGDTQTQPEPFGIGFVGATILWEMTWDLIDIHGFDPDLHNAEGAAGNLIALQLVTEGLKLQPCSPGFVDIRDAILAADQVLYGGAHEETLWNAFARRGLGLSADQGSSHTNADNVEAFDTPFPSGIDEPSAPAPAVTVAPISPNPAVHYARVEFALARADLVRVSAYDIRGRRVIGVVERTHPPGVHALRMDTRNLAAGVYILRVETSTSVATRRFSIAR